MVESRGWIVEGQVQGVGFRWFVQQRARQLKLVGTVRNLPDASVEVMAAGPAEKLAELEAAIRRGPPHADVHQLKRIDVPAGLELADSFAITR